jgi:hypothetical protein
VVQPPGPLAAPACGGGNSNLGYTAYGTALTCGTALSSGSIANGATQLGVYIGLNAIGPLTGVNNGILTFNGSGVPTPSITLPSGLTIPGFAPLASPTFTGTPLAPTPTTADNTTKIATTAYVQAQGYAPMAAPTLSAPTLSGAVTVSGLPMAPLLGTDPSGHLRAITLGTNLTLSGGGTTLNASGGASGNVTWPAADSLVISNSTNSPSGLAPVNNSLVYGTGNAWTALAPVASSVPCVDSTSILSMCSPTTMQGILGYLTGNQTITLGGDASGMGTTAITVTNSKVNGVSYPATPLTNTIPYISSANQVSYGAAATILGVLGTPFSVPNGGTGLATLTTGAIYKGAGTANMAVSSLSDNGALVSTTEPLDLTNQSQVIEIANASSGGTTNGLLAKLSGAPSRALTALTSDTDNAIGVVLSGGGTTGNAQIVVGGQANCSFDGSTTAGDWVVISTTVAGKCHDTASGTRPGGAQVIGRVLATNGGGAGSYAMVFSPEFTNTAGSPPTWPASGSIVVSNTTNTPGALAPVNNDLVYGTGGAWAALPSAASSILCTNGSSVPSLCSTASVLTLLGAPFTVANGGTGLTTQTANAIYKGNGASSPVVSGLTDNGTIVSTSEHFDFTSKAIAVEIPNAGTGGTTAGLVAKFSGAPSTALTTLVSDTDAAIGVVIGGAGTTGSAQIAIHGQASCTFDGATTAGHFVVLSSTVAGNCHDGGATRPAGVQTIGNVLSTNAAGGSFPIEVILDFTNTAGSAPTWPTSGDIVVSNGTNTPAGIVPVNGDCIIGSAGAWVAGSCLGGGSVTSAGTSTVNNIPFWTGTDTLSNVGLPVGTTGNSTIAETLGTGLLSNAIINWAAPSAIGGTTPAGGAFTTLSASSTVSGTGFSTYLASPPAIGGSAPAAGAFTTLSASGAVSGTGFSTYLASPPAIGGTAPAGGAFTTLSASGAVSGTGFSTYLASPPAIGATTSAAGSFTALSASGAVTGVGFSNYLASPPGIGGTVAAAGSFTTLAASSTVSGTGFSTYLASPPAIGGTAAAGGSFTTLSASAGISGVGFSNYLASPPAIGGTSAAAGAFTTLSASSTVSGTGFSTYLASPPSIGATAPAAGKFTTLTATGAITATGLATGTQVSCLGLNASNVVVLLTGSCGTGGGATNDTGTTGVTAAGTTLGTATDLTTQQNYVGSGANCTTLANGCAGTAAVRFDAALMVAFNHLYVCNEDANNALLVYPDTTAHFINNQAAGVGIPVQANQCGHFIVKSATTLRTVP